MKQKMSAAGTIEMQVWGFTKEDYLTWIFSQYVTDVRLVQELCELRPNMEEYNRLLQHQ